MPGDGFWSGQARAVVSLLRERTAAIEDGRELTADVLDALHERELFRLTLPAHVGGYELPIPVLASVTEVIAGADASTAWCLGQAFGCAMSAAFLDEDAALQVFGPSDAVLAWGAGPQGTAVATDGGYVVNGTWRFASGAKHATWLGGHCKVHEGDGTPRLAANGVQKLRTALFPREQASIADDWYVMGLRGTRSEGYTVENLFVESRLTLDRETPEECRVDSTLFKFPTTNVYASVFSGVALGIARAMLDDFVQLASRKSQRGARTSMRESAVIHTRLAELEAQLGAARAYQRETIRKVWDEVDAKGEITMSQRARIRLATTHAINQATGVSEQVYRLAGSTAIFEDHAFERRFRDAYAVSQQVQGRHTNFETVGRHLLGLDVETIFM
ncbi:MAG: acyl-CoA dehydrogenase family protein [Gammaproteobacteria bacterium]|nr:acyl-CoA dehydrogenase family protein [Gammaproteobacteria bacterium]